jgi:hypothetical protein
LVSEIDADRLPLKKIFPPNELSKTGVPDNDPLLLFPDKSFHTVEPLI